MARDNTAPINSDYIEFKIGAASRMTGIPVDTLRVWERRYSVVSPKRSSGSDRLYSRDDINRLLLIKMLVDRGHSIGSIAKLSDESLKECLSIPDLRFFNENSFYSKERPLHVAVMGNVLPLRIQQNKSNDECIKYIGLHRNMPQFLTTINDKHPELIVLEYPAIHKDTVIEARRIFRESGVRHAILIYGFASSKDLESFDRSEFTLIQATISINDLNHELLRIANTILINNKNDYSIQQTESTPPRIFTDKGLVEASMASTTVKCECPHHLSTIIQKLIEFEIYSEDCENRNEKDKKLHAYLKTTTGHARAMMETALQFVVEDEGISVEKFE